MNVLRRIIFSLFILIELYFLLCLFLVFIYPVVDSNISNVQLIICGGFFLLSVLGVLFQVSFLKKNGGSYLFFMIFIPLIIFGILFFNVIVERINLNNNVAKGKKNINDYLVNKYGENNYSISFSEYYNGCHIICTDSPQWNFVVNSSEISEFNISLNSSLDSVVSDSFASSIIDKYDLINLYSSDIINSYNINYYDSLVSLFFGIDDFKYNSQVSDLTSINTYTLNSLSIKSDNFNEKEFINMIKKIYSIDRSNFNISDNLQFYFSDSSDGYYVYGNITRIDDSIHISFKSYNSSFPDYDIKFSL